MQRSRAMMGTIVTLFAPAEHNTIIQKGFERLQRVESALSGYDRRAEIYRLNHERSVRISNDTYAALKLCKKYYRQSSGYFNIAVGAITRKGYRFGEAERLPSTAQLKKAKLDIRGLTFDTHRAVLAKGITLDLGGMGKGFGVDRVTELYRDHHVTSGRIALSGDIRCIDRCTLEIADPFHAEGIVARMQSTAPGLAVSTSGNYRRFVKSKTHNHLIDPFSKTSERRFASVTLFSFGSSADLDAYATAASVMPLGKALAFLEKVKVGYILYTVDGDRILSPALERFVREIRFFQLL